MQANCLTRLSPASLEGHLPSSFKPQSCCPIPPKNGSAFPSCPKTEVLFGTQRSVLNPARSQLRCLHRGQAPHSVEQRHHGELGVVFHIGNVPLSYRKQGLEGEKVQFHSDPSKKTLKMEAGPTQGRGNRAVPHTPELPSSSLPPYFFFSHRRSWKPHAAGK